MLVNERVLIIYSSDFFSVEFSSGISTPAEFSKTDLHQPHIQISQLGELPRSMQQAERRQRGHNYLAPKLATQL